MLMDLLQNEVRTLSGFARVGGTACGGATFLGLGRALTGVSDFNEQAPANLLTGL